jgi:hypothetical protein
VLLEGPATVLIGMAMRVQAQRVSTSLQGVFLGHRAQGVLKSAPCGLPGPHFKAAGSMAAQQTMRLSARAIISRVRLRVCRCKGEPSDWEADGRW